MSAFRGRVLAGHGTRPEPGGNISLASAALFGELTFGTDDRFSPVRGHVRPVRSSANPLLTHGCRAMLARRRCDEARQGSPVAGLASVVQCQDCTY